MNVHDRAKIELGRQWLAKMKYRPEWSNEQFIDAVNREGVSPEAKSAIIFTLKHDGEQALAEGDALISEADEMQIKFDLGSEWLAHIGYDTDWTTDQIINAVELEGINDEGVKAIIFTLQYKSAVFRRQATELHNLSRTRSAAN